MRRRALLLLVAIGGLVGCETRLPRTSYLPENLFVEGTGKRVFREVVYDTVWQYGVGDTILGSANRIEAFSNGEAAVLDVRNQQVHRIGPNGVVWSWGRQGEGPREVRDVRAMTVNARQEVVLADSRNRRLIWLSNDGKWLREVALPQGAGRWGITEVRGIVALDGGGYILDQMAPEPWIRVSSAGEVIENIPVPWEGFGEMHPLQTIGEVIGGRGDLWVFGFRLGNGFFVFSGTDYLGSYPYVAHVDFPGLVTSFDSGGRIISISYPDRPYEASQDLALIGDTMIVSLANVLDHYSAITGAYLESTLLPSPVRGVAISDEGHFLVIDTTGLFPVVTSLHARGEKE